MSTDLFLDNYRQSSNVFLTSIRSSFDTLFTVPYPNPALTKLYDNIVIISYNLIVFPIFTNYDRIPRDTIGILSNFIKDGGSLSIKARNLITEEGNKFINYGDFIKERSKTVGVSIPAIPFIKEAADTNVSKPVKWSRAWLAASYLQTFSQSRINSAQASNEEKELLNSFACVDMFLNYAEAILNEFPADTQDSVLLVVDSQRQDMYNMHHSAVPFSETEKANLKAFYNWNI